MAVMDSPAPVQILSAEALRAASGNGDLMSTLAQIVPSLTMQAFGYDMAEQTLLAKLRGLSPNHVLVLVDGKRRHTTANLAVDGGSPYQGGAGVDLNFLPVDAIDHIEVLTDGAAAQYGTDAIAGVINIILKKSSSGGSVNASAGQYGNSQGRTYDASLNSGFEPGNGAYLNVTGEIRRHAHSNVSGPDQRLVNPDNLATYPNSNMVNAPGYPNLNQGLGDGQTLNRQALVNSGVTFGNGTQVYFSGTFAHKNAEAYQNYRLPSKAHYIDPVSGQTVYPYPFGFSPLEATSEDDFQTNLGIKGTTGTWNWDVTTGYGGDKVSLSTLHTYNTGYSSLYNVPSPTDIYDGRLQANQWTTTADFNRDIDLGWAGPLNVAFGAEYRHETYGIHAGAPISYLAGGASGYPGFTPSDAGSHSRNNEAVYLDLAAHPIEPLRLDAAVRTEHYSDFGHATVGKLTGRYDFTPAFALRGTVSNGFRAPTLAEEYYTSTVVNTTTAFVQLAPDSPGGRLLGLGNGLQAEHSVNFSLGMVWRPTPRMSATLDLYQITVTNRIVGSGQIIGSAGGTIYSPIVNDAIIASGNPIDPSVVASGTTGINIFANGIDTRTRGADLVFTFPVDYSFGKVTWSASATYNNTTVTKYATTPNSLAGGNPPIDELYDPTAYSDLTTATPKYTVNLGALFTVERFSANLLEKIYGPSSDYESDDGDNGQGGPFPACTARGGLFICPGGLDYYRNEIPVTAITNLDLSYQFSEHLRFSIGALNLFNKLPPHLNATILAHESSFYYGDSNSVIQYPIFSPYGINGGFYYVRIGATF
ncbi:MAG: TonB-dependent receptor [Proteobacteria bacterium]|nr:TonB-dependent receptor [Pseudomonadota bacterium]